MTRHKAVQLLTFKTLFLGELLVLDVLEEIQVFELRAQ